VNPGETLFHSLWKKIGVTFVFCSKELGGKTHTGVKKGKTTV